MSTPSTVESLWSDSVFSPVPARNVFEVTVERLASAIRLGVLTAGDQLPPERDLADLLGVSRVTLREAIKALRDHVSSEIGPIAKPRQIMVVEELPKTRSGKIMRRLLRDVAENREVGDVSTLVVRVPVSERDVATLQADARVDVTLDALPGRSLEGTVRRIFPAADSVTRLVPVEVALADLDRDSLAQQSQLIVTRLAL